MSYLNCTDAQAAVPTCRALAASAIAASNARAVAWAILSYLDGRTSIYDIGSSWCSRSTTMLLAPPGIMLPQVWRMPPAVQVTAETEIPAHVETLVLYCQPLRKLPKLTDSRLHELRVLQCQQLTELPERLPAQLVRLVVATCPRITAVPQLPRHISEFKLIGCPNVKTLPPLQRLHDMKLLSVQSNSSLTCLPELTQGIEQLRLHNCSALSELPKRLPASLKLCHITQCVKVKELPHLPAALEDLSIAWSSGITALPDQLPEELLRLSTASCSRIARFPSLPAKLQHLNVSWCMQLKDEPAGLERVQACEKAGAGFTRAKLPGLKRHSEMPLGRAPTFARLTIAGASSSRFTSSRAVRA